MAVREGRLTGWMSAHELVLELEDGDLIEINRGIYSHWGVAFDFDGERMLVHFTDRGFSPSILADAFVEAADGCFCRVNNSFDGTHKPLTTHEILDRCMQSLGTRDYDLLQNNCEHFCKWARNGVKVSHQVHHGLALLNQVLGNTR